MPQLLLELRSEEIPARMQARAAADLERLVCAALKKAGLAYDQVQGFATPRRLTLVVDGLPGATPDISEERRGPRADAPEKAVNGFLGSVGLSLDQVEKRETEKGEFLFAVIEKAGEATTALLPEIFNQVFQTFPWPKSMRWGSGSERWVRPLHGVLCLFDGKAVDGVAFGDVVAGESTAGHPFLASDPITVTDFADYQAKLEDARVLLDPTERRARILEQAQALAAEKDLSLKDDPALLDEVAGLVEYPVALLGRIDPQFMDLPPEVLTTSMRKHQKYFALEDADGNLAPYFITVADTETPDGGAAIIAGNERVLRARLADARFFWDTDRQTRLDERVPALAEIVFHAKLGSLAEKMERVEALAGQIAGTNGEKAGRAARLAKADLSTGMVGEFPDLQGLIGRYYALENGEAEDVALAIAEHYSPQGPNDTCPSAPLSIAVALADKIDTLVGFWSIDEKPTGSKDPFALRRAALGVIRLILENELTFALRGLIDASWKTFGDGEDLTKSQQVSEDLRFFIFERLKVHLRDKGVRHDLIDALLARGGEDDLLRIVRKADVLSDFLQSDDGANLLIAYRRAANILRIEEKKDGADYDGVPEESALKQDEEIRLNQELAKVQGEISADVKADRFAEAMPKLASLRQPVDNFFDQVTVNCDEPELRVNRLKLLSQIRAVIHQVADFSQIEGGER